MEDSQIYLVFLMKLGDKRMQNVGRISHRAYVDVNVTPTPAGNFSRPEEKGHSSALFMMEEGSMD